MIIELLAAAAFSALAEDAQCESMGAFDAPRVYADVLTAINGDDAQRQAFSEQYGWGNDDGLDITFMTVGAKAAVDQYIVWKTRLAPCCNPQKTALPSRCLSKLCQAMNRNWQVWACVAAHPKPRRNRLLRMFEGPSFRR